MFASLICIAIAGIGAGVVGLLASSGPNEPWSRPSTDPDSRGARGDNVADGGLWNGNGHPELDPHSGSGRVASIVGAVDARPAPSSDSGEGRHTFALGSFLRSAASKVGLEVAVPIWALQWRTAFDVLGASSVSSATDGLLAVEVDGEGPVLAVDFGVIGRNLRHATRTLTDWWDSATRQAAMVPAWSLTLLGSGGDSLIERGVLGEVRADSASTIEATEGAITERVVVLVHGLDEPGWIWDDLAPALCEQGFSPIAFEYPNDGPVSVAAECLGAALTALRQRGVERVDLVGHSMGGLVVRDALTRPELYGGDGRGNPALPVVDRVILVATPNHGAPVARFQPLAEIKDQAVRGTRGAATARGWQRDGHGEAARDLLPDSTFLQELNARPLPCNVDLTIVAGALAGAASMPLAQPTSERRSTLGRDAEAIERAHRGTTARSARTARAARGSGAVAPPVQGEAASEASADRARAAARPAPLGQREAPSAKRDPLEPPEAPEPPEPPETQEPAGGAGPLGAPKRPAAPAIAPPGAALASAPTADGMGVSSPSVAAALAAASAASGQAVRWLGDGLVTVDSACLAGVADTVVVAGNHQSVLRAWKRGSTPPAVEIIVNRLQADRADPR
ncbi:MAG TPA: hypothetical protein PKC43_14830 [Phycisphaerales bacterium]|mgnify:CR=1 FL=1|nr:hypothetical protein [Phycisphaerales bacterium]HMP38708.1 hypothetical protein [Phycisphaerales bacterium]